MNYFNTLILKGDSILNIFMTINFNPLYRTLFISLFISISYSTFSQKKFNGMISTYADTTAVGYNGIIETNYYEQKNYNGIYTTFVDSISNKNFNGIIETFITEIPVKTKITSIYFDFNKTNTDTKALMQELKNIPIKSILLIEGFTDSKGTKSINDKISLLRAKQVANSLKKAGYKCKYEGKGIDFSTSDDYARRCDIYIYTTLQKL